MNLSYFISKRISQTEKGSFSRTIHKVAVASIAIGLGIMLISFLILAGFRDTIQEKIFSFGAHLQISKFTLGNVYEEEPIPIHTELYDNYRDHQYIEHVQEFSHKPGLLKTDEEVWGVMLKGVGARFDTARFQKNMLEGGFINFSDSAYSNEILISKKVSNLLHLQLHDEVLIYFIQTPPRFRKLMVKGIYETGLEDFDEKVIIGDIGLVQRLNGWSDNQAGGMEVYIKNFDELEEAEDLLYDLVDFDLYVEKVSDRYIQIFDWLTLLNRNVVIFLALILFVACFNMVSILLILIMERTQMIGILKAVGARNGQIRKIFRYNGISLILKGMLFGNIAGLGFGVLQQYATLIPLDQENYYMNFVPIAWDWPVLFAINLLTFTLVTAVLIVPTMIIIRIKPIKAIKFS